MMTESQSEFAVLLWNEWNKAKLLSVRIVGLVGWVARSFYSKGYLSHTPATHKCSSHSAGVEAQFDVWDDSSCVDICYDVF